MIDRLNYTLACTHTQEVNFNIIRTPFWCILSKTVPKKARFSGCATPVTFALDTGILRVICSFSTRTQSCGRFACTVFKQQFVHIFSGKKPAFFTCCFAVHLPFGCCLTVSIRSVNPGAFPYLLVQGFQQEKAPINCLA